MFTRLWADEDAVIATTDLLLISVIVVIGTVVGLATLRDHVVQEFADIAAGVASLDQSFSFSGASITFAGSTFTVAGSDFEDNTDECDTGETMGGGAQCVDVTVAAGSE